MRYICTSIVATLALAGTSFAATINVPGDHATIQGAINASSNGDVIAIAAGTYHEHSLNPNGKAITIGSASGNLDVTIDANGGGSVFVIEWCGTGTVIKDLVITGGSGKTGGGWGYPFGGGFYCFESAPTIIGCTISDNSGYFGGGIYSQYSNPQLIGCTMSGNYPDMIYGYATLIANTTSTTGACCLNSTCITATESDCTAAGGTYAGDDVVCADAGCATPPVMGACCVSSGCHNLTETACTGMGGTWLGEGGSCDDCLAAEPTGACCVSSGCVATIKDDCTALGGTWLGIGDSCDDCPASCMGDTDGNGVVNIEDLLNMIGSWGACP
jgi:parallel beta-helix repeat protein